MNILITGGIGFIGSYFSSKFCQNAKNNIHIIDNFTGHSKSGLEYLKKQKNVQIHHVDIVKDKLDKYFKNIDIVYHFAANSKISEGVNNADIDFEISALGTHRILKSMANNEVKHILYTSGSGVYGDQKELKLSEDFGPSLPVSFYGASKLCAEAYISSFVGMKGIKASIFRFANVVGFRQTHGVVYDFFHNLKKDPSDLHVLGNGLQSKSYIDVEDIFAAVELVREKQRKDIDVFNVATEDYITVKEIAEIVVERMKLETNIHYQEQSEGWVGDVPIIRFNSNKLRSLGWNNLKSTKAAIISAIDNLIEE